MAGWGRSEDAVTEDELFSTSSIYKADSGVSARCVVYNLFSEHGPHNVDDALAKTSGHSDSLLGLGAPALASAVWNTARNGTQPLDLYRSAIAIFRSTNQHVGKCAAIMVLAGPMAGKRVDSRRPAGARGSASPGLSKVSRSRRARRPRGQPAGGARAAAGPPRPLTRPTARTTLAAVWLP
jgi:hypothetical protein